MLHVKTEKFRNDEKNVLKSTKYLYFGPHKCKEENSYLNAKKLIRMLLHEIDVADWAEIVGILHCMYRVIPATLPKPLGLVITRPNLSFSFIQY